MSKFIEHQSKYIFRQPPQPKSQLFFSHAVTHEKIFKEHWLKRKLCTDNDLFVVVQKNKAHSKGTRLIFPIFDHCTNSLSCLVLFQSWKRNKSRFKPKKNNKKMGHQVLYHALFAVGDQNGIDGIEEGIKRQDNLAPQEQPGKY